MIYYLVGEESLIKKKINDIINDENITSNSISKYDLSYDSISSVLEDINTYSLFADKKCIIVYNLLKIDNEEEIIKYINSPSDNILILIDYSTDERRKLIKLLKEKTKFINITSDDLNSYIKSYIDIDNFALELLKEYCNNNYFRIKNELDKLKIISSIENRKINQNDIKENVQRSLDDNVFELTDAIKERNKSKIFLVYENLKKSKVEDLQLLALLANHIRLLYKVKIMVEDKCKDDFIKDKLNIHPYRVKLFKEESNYYSKSKLKQLILDLNKLDIDIKSGKVDSSIGMKIFLSKFV